MSKNDLHKVVIIGGGAGGLELATQLGRKLGKKGAAKITLVDRSLTHVWKPLWHEVAAGTLDSNADELNYLVHAYRNQFNFEYGHFTGLDRANKHITLAPVLDEQGQEIIAARQIAYDTLIIAIGSMSNDFGVAGVKQYCSFLDSRTQSEEFRLKFLKHFFQIQNQFKPVNEAELTIGIVGGGATGIELAAELHYAISQAALYSLHTIEPQSIKLVIIESAPNLLANLSPRLSQDIQRELTKREIKVFTNERVNKIDASGIYTQRGLFIPCILKVWAAGIKAPDFLRELDGLAVNKLNQLLVEPTLQTTLDENIFAFGDCASCPQPGTDKTVPPRAQSAHQQAAMLVKTIKRRLKNKSLPKFHYQDYGSLISLSHYTAIGNLMGSIGGSVMLEGTIARFVYLMLYKNHQAALLGWWRVLLLSIAQLLTRRIKPRLKLH